MVTLPPSTMTGTDRSPFDHFSIAFMESALALILTYSKGTFRFA